MVSVTQATTPQQIEDVRNLLREFNDWHRVRYHQEKELVDNYFDTATFENELDALPGVYVPPTGRLLLAFEEDNLAGCVSLQDLGNGVCEMKRMFVSRDFNGRGIGRLLSDTVIAEAKLAKYKIMRLYTGTGQFEAQGLYKKLGFKPINAYCDLPDDLRGWLMFMELDLTD